MALFGIVKLPAIVRSADVATVRRRLVVENLVEERDSRRTVFQRGNFSAEAWGEY